MTKTKDNVVGVIVLVAYFAMLVLAFANAKKAKNEKEEKVS